MNNRTSGQPVVHIAPHQLDSVQHPEFAVARRPQTCPGSGILITPRCPILLRHDRSATVVQVPFAGTLVRADYPAFGDIRDGRTSARGSCGGRFTQERRKRSDLPGGDREIDGSPAWPSSHQVRSISTVTGTWSLRAAPGVTHPSKGAMSTERIKSLPQAVRSLLRTPVRGAVRPSCRHRVR